jgi:Secretion system C-terminal sorting domain
MQTKLILKRLFLLSIFLCTIIFTRITANAQELKRNLNVAPVAKAVINMSQLADMEKLLPRPPIVKQGDVPNEKEKYIEPIGIPSPYQPPIIIQNRIQVASPPSVLNYEAAPDEAKGGGPSGSYTIPPDTYAAVGLDKVFITVNNNYKILNKTTGAQLSLVSMNSFWSALGAFATSPFDPRTVYDPYNNRWIMTAVAQSSSVNSRLLLAISQTHDPSGNYNLFSFDPDPSATTHWADYPTMGFNKNWVAISVNMFAISGGTFSDSRLWVLDYPTLLSGIANATTFTGIVPFTLYFAETYSASENTLYGANHSSSASATYFFHSITGSASLPTLNLGGSALLRPGGGWTQPAGNSSPQTCVTSCPGTLQFIDVGDSRISGNLVFRNNAIWYAQTVGLPTGTATHMGVQWTKLNTAGVFVDGGRIEVPTATNANGEQWYTYPSLAVNANDDVLTGFTKTESDGYAGAAYAFRYGTDAAGTMQDPVVYKDGEDYYDKTSSGRTRWGDYSHTVIDPVDDASFWTVQEYAKPRAAPTVFSTTAKWGTWVAKVAPNLCLSNVASGNWNTAATWGCAAVPNSAKHVTIIAGQNVTLDTDPLAATITVNEGATITVNSTRTLSCKLIVYGTLNITGGKLALGANNVFLSESATVTGASSTSYFVTSGTGTVSKIIAGGGSFEFPVSPNTSSYNSLIITNTAGNPAEVYSVRVSTGLTPTASSSASCVQRTWNINEMTAGSNPSTLTFKWASGEHGGAFNAGATPYAYRHNGSAYVIASTLTLPSLVSGIYSSSTTATVSSFSPWIVASTSTLPIIVDYFTGIKQAAGTHKLDWKATPSGNVAIFELQHSKDGIRFANSNSTVADYNRCLQPFTYTNMFPVSGKNLYRLKMTDEAGKVTYSPVVLLINTTNGFDIISIQPNPVTNIATVEISSAIKEEVQIRINDQKGSIVKQQRISLEKGINQNLLELTNLSSGAYILTIITGTGDKKSIRFIKQ